MAISGATSSPYEFTLAAGTIPLGTHRVKIIATDKLGNRASSDTVTFTLTNGLPTTTIACDGLACSSNWQKGPVEVSLSAIESGNGVGATRYTLDGSDPDTGSTEYTGPFTLTEATTVKFRSYDSDGNAEQVRSQEIKLDAVAPTAAISSPADGSDQVGAVNVDGGRVGRGLRHRRRAALRRRRLRRHLEQHGFAVLVHARRRARFPSGRTSSRRSRPTSSATRTARRS